MSAPHTYSRRVSVSVFIFFSFFFQCAFSQGKYRLASYVYGAGYYSYYKANKNHLAGEAPRLSYMVGFREEIRFENMIALTAGIEFFSHGIKFDSYYFSEGHSFLYNKKFDYNYKLTLFELNMPLMVRANYMGRHRDKPAAYFEIGAVPRYIIGSTLKVSDDASELYAGRAGAGFEYPLITRSANAFLQFNTGMHFYNNDKTTSYFLELNVKFAPIRFYVERSFAANSLYFHNFHFGLCGGVCF